MEESTVSLEDLAKAAEDISDVSPEPLAEQQDDEQNEQVTDEEVKTEKIEEKVEEEPTDNRERSKLGRRLSALEASMQTFMEELRTTMKPKPDESFIQDEYELDTPVTKRELEMFLEQRETRSKTHEQKYVADYNRMFKSIEADSEDQHFTNK